jgi:hypothetical protein
MSEQTYKLQMNNIWENPYYVINLIYLIVKNSIYNLQYYFVF